MPTVNCMSIFYLIFSCYLYAYKYGDIHLYLYLYLYSAFPLDTETIIDRKESLRISPRISEFIRSLSEKSSTGPNSLRLALRYGLKYSLRKLLLVAI